jgi:hypothetical protein
VEKRTLLGAMKLKLEEVLAFVDFKIQDINVSLLKELEVVISFSPVS